jgi:predicted Rossmann-fold nucleotide-binding protein
MVVPKVDLLAATAGDYGTTIEALLLIEVKKTGEMGRCPIFKVDYRTTFAASLANESTFRLPWRPRL